jgi:hypothetical protein
LDGGAQSYLVGVDIIGLPTSLNLDCSVEFVEDVALPAPGGRLVGREPCALLSAVRS